MFYTKDDRFDGFILYWDLESSHLGVFIIHMQFPFIAQSPGLIFSSAKVKSEY